MATEKKSGFDPTDTLAMLLHMAAFFMLLVLVLFLLNLAKIDASMFVAFAPFVYFEMRHFKTRVSGHSLYKVEFIMGTTMIVILYSLITFYAGLTNNIAIVEIVLFCVSGLLFGHMRHLVATRKQK